MGSKMFVVFDYKLKEAGDLANGGFKIGLMPVRIRHMRYENV